VRDLVFVSYSHRDEVWRDRFRILFKPYVRKGRLQIWDDGHIQTGEQWQRLIEEHLAQTRVGLLLLSPNFAASDYIFKEELPRLRARVAEGGATLFGVPVSALDPAAVELESYQWARPPNQPLDLLPEAERNRALVELARRVVSICEPAVSGEGSDDAHLAPGASSLRTVSVVGLKDKPGRATGRLHGVPETPPHFVSRPSMLSDLKAALLGSEAQRHGIGTSLRAGLHGQGGIGKTVLAIALCREAEVQRAFPDGIFWLTLGQDPDLLALQRLLHQLVTDQPVDFPSVTVGLVALRETLQRKSCLIVLDDVWQGGDLTAFDALGPRGRLLVTTRDREILRAIDARIQNVDLLPESDALDLLGLWAGVPRRELPSEAIEVARECGFLPLALSLAGARVGEGDRWDDVRDRLRAGDLEFLDHAHHSVFKSLSLSVRALATGEQARYRELAIFPEDAAVPETIVVRLWSASGLSAAESRRLLGRLASRALLSLTRRDVNGDRDVRFHDLQGDYLRLIADDIDRAHARLLDATVRTLPPPDRGHSRWAGLPAHETYLWQHLFQHLLGAGQALEAAALVRDCQWLAAKISASGVSALLTEMAALRPRASDEASAQVERALRLEAGWLHVAPEALPSLLYNRLMINRLGAADIERLVPDLHPPVRLVHPVDIGASRIFRGHRAGLTACAISPDGARILSASLDETLREWDRATGRELRQFVGHYGPVYACAYSADGARVLSAAGDKTLREWDRASGNELLRFEGHTAAVTGCAYSPDGALIVSSALDKTLREWDRSSGREVRRYEGHARGVTACAYSMNSARILSASNDGTVREWSRATAREDRRYEGHTLEVSACAYSPDGKFILSASHDKDLREWNRTTGQVVRRYEGHQRKLTACAYSPDGRRVLSASADQTISEWDRVTGRELWRYEDHTASVTACAYGPDARVISASADHTLREWEPGESTAGPHLARHDHEVNACAFSPDGLRILSAAGDHMLREWDRSNGEELQIYEGHDGAVTACAYCSDGVHFLSASDDGTLREWRRGKVPEVARYQGHAQRVTACAYSPDGTRFLSAGWDYKVNEWSRDDGAHRDVMGRGIYEDRVTACVYSPDGSRFLSASIDGTLTEWNLNTCERLRRYDGHLGPVNACAYSPDGGRVLSASQDKTLHEYDRVTGRLIRRFEGHSRAVTACAYSPDGQHFISASNDSTLRIWSVADARSLDTVHGAAPFRCVAATRGHSAAGDALGNLWILACDWF